MQFLMMSSSDDERYMVRQTQTRRKSDACAAKAWILTAKTIFPNSFNVQFEDYLLERDAKNFEEAAKCFSTIATNFPNQHAEMWLAEINALTQALRESEDSAAPEHEFYVKMYKHLAPDVQHSVFMHTINNSEDNLEQCKLLILMLNKFPKTAPTQASRLLEMLAEGIKTDVDLYQRMLVEDVLPLIQQKPPELSPTLACQLYTSSLEYYMRQIMDDEKCDFNEAWKNIFNLLMTCSKMMHWEPFLPFSSIYNQNIYWDRLVQILSAHPAGSSQVLFYATTLFIYSLHGYIRNCKVRIEDMDISHVLVEGFIEWSLDGEVHNLEPQPPKFSLTTSISQDLSKAFLHAAQCWQLLNTDQFQRDFSQLMLALPLAPWISRFLFDLAIYFGHRDEANKLMTDMSTQSTLVRSLQILSLNLMQGSMTLQGFQCILKILTELPGTCGQLLENMTLPLKGQRHMIFLPLTRTALVQYCTRALINTLSRKLFEPNCTDRLLGDLLVLLQLNVNGDDLLKDEIYKMIKQRNSFDLRTLSTYIISIEAIEELLYLWNTQPEDASFELSGSPTNGGSSGSARRIGTRGADKGAKDEFRALIRQQTARSNENVTALVTNFINQEHATLAQHIFGVGDHTETIVIT